MRFNKETRALIHEAAPHPVTIPWPVGEREPQKGRLYWMQSEEDAAEAEKKAEARREHSPETCAEVLAGMHRRRYGKEPEGRVKRKRRHRAPASRPKAGNQRIMVIDTTILEKGWEAIVAVYEDPDPVHHSGVKAKVPGGPNHLYEGIYEPVELEPEQLTPKESRQRRLEAEEALRIEHKASVDYSQALKAERKLLSQRRKGKRLKRAEEAVERAKRRAVLAAAEISG